ncbi:MAG: hypothetical protein FJ108_01710 [Deltaproteobacteria bacterium]|nr:hypothetical protein [Deltaproteobacteria bacterium]
MRSDPEAIETAASLMLGFAERTGLGSSRPTLRYLWTDARGSFAPGDLRPAESASRLCHSTV